jgi:group I intron endonuclease
MQIYKTTNLINDKIYVGQDTHDNPKYLGSGKLIQRSIKKYGKENFVKEILEYCDTKEQLCEREIYWIAKFKSTDRNIGYNITPGGEWGDTFTNNPNKEEIRKKMGEKSKGRKQSEETKEKRRKKMSGKNNPMFGRKWTKEEIQYLSDIKIGENNPMFGKKQSNETKEKISEKNSKPVLQYDKQMKFIAEYKSATEAAHFLNLKIRSNINRCCNHFKKYSAGFIWKYKNE